MTLRRLSTPIALRLCAIAVGAFARLRLGIADLRGLFVSCMVALLRPFTEFALARIGIAHCLLAAILGLFAAGLLALHLALADLHALVLFGFALAGLFAGIIALTSLCVAHRLLATLLGLFALLRLTPFVLLAGLLAAVIDLLAGFLPVLIAALLLFVAVVLQRGRHAAAGGQHQAEHRGLRPGCEQGIHAFHFRASVDGGRAAAVPVGKLAARHLNEI